MAREKINEIEGSVLKTIVYYDCLNHPLKKNELKSFLFFKKTEDKNLSLDFYTSKLLGNNLIDFKDNFYFLKGRDGLVKERKIRNKIWKIKVQKAIRIIKWLRLIPYIRLVFFSGSLALGNTTKNSDLDVLIVVKFGRIWLTRFLVAGLMTLLGVRRKKSDLIAPDKICLNHFITDHSLHIPHKSIYTSQLYARLIPVLIEDENLLNEFIEENSWINDYIYGWPSSSGLKIWHFRVNKNKFISYMKLAFEKILNTKLGDFLERILKYYQLKRIEKSVLIYKKRGRIKTDDYSLEFHPDSPEGKIIERYNKKMIEIGFPEMANEKDSGLL